MFGVLNILSPVFGIFRGALHSSGAVVADFFGSNSAKGRKTVLVLILLGLLVLIPQLRVKMAQHAAKEAALKAETLQADVARAELSAKSAEQQRDAEAEARVQEREEARKAMAASEFFLAQQKAREETVNNRLKVIADVLKARQAGDRVAGDSALILRNLGKVGVESVPASSDHREATPASADPVPAIVGPAAGAGPDAGPGLGSADRPADGGIREVAGAGGTQQ